MKTLADQLEEVGEAFSEFGNVVVTTLALSVIKYPLQTIMVIAIVALVSHIVFGDRQ